MHTTRHRAGTELEWLSYLSCYAGFPSCITAEVLVF